MVFDPNSDSSKVMTSKALFKHSPLAYVRLTCQRTLITLLYEPVRLCPVKIQYRTKSLQGIGFCREIAYKLGTIEHTGMYAMPFNSRAS